MTIVIDMVPDSDDSVPIDGYEIDKLPPPKKATEKKQPKERRKELDLPLQEHEWVSSRNSKI